MSLDLLWTLDVKKRFDRVNVFVRYDAVYAITSIPSIPVSPVPLLMMRLKMLPIAMKITARSQRGVKLERRANPMALC